MSNVLSNISKWVGAVLSNPVFIAVLLMIALHYQPRPTWPSNPTIWNVLVVIGVGFCGVWQTLMSLELRDAEEKLQQWRIEEGQASAILSEHASSSSVSEREIEATLNLPAVNPLGMAKLLAAVFSTLPKERRGDADEDYLRLITRRGVNAEYVAEQIQYLEGLLLIQRKPANGKGLNDALVAIIPFLKEIRDRALMDADPLTAALSHYVVEEALERIAPAIMREN